MIREQFDWLADNDKRMLIIDELDAVARSRHESQMHTDDKASVNELLAQIDRVLRLGRLIVATTNFIGSMDDAVIRSGRFGRFIPVPLPDLEEASLILSFYLDGLNEPIGLDKKMRVQVPHRNRLSQIVEPFYVQNLEEGKLYCGADLEEAVNRAYLRSLRKAFPDGGWIKESSAVEIKLTEDELTRSLAEVPRSIQEDAVEQFLGEVNRYCDQDVAQILMRRLRPLDSAAGRSELLTQSEIVNPQINFR
jgi:SpoVK/Ycf46/Vps4 family AAA+-type ATPase